MKFREPMLLFWGAVLIAGALWVRFGIGHDSWTNWLMGGVGVVFLGFAVALRRR